MAQLNMFNPFVSFMQIIALYRIINVVAWSVRALYQSLCGVYTTSGYVIFQQHLDKRASYIAFVQ